MAKKKPGLFLILAIVALVITSDVFPLASLQQTISVKNTIQKFYKAVNAIFSGNVDPMKQIWSHAKDVTYMAPDGSFNVGWNDVLSDWTSQAKKHLRGEVKPTNIHIIVNRNLAIVQSYVKGYNIDQAGQKSNVSLRATVVLRNKNNQWKVISVHTDVLPFLKK